MTAATEVQSGLEGSPTRCRRARHERLNVHGAGGRLDRRRRGCGAVGRGGRPLRLASRGRPSRVLKMLDDVEAIGDAERYVKELLDRGERLTGFGYRVYRAEDPRACVLPRTAHKIGSARVEVAEALERAALAELQARKPDRVLATNVEFWSAVVLDFADVPPELLCRCSPARAPPAGRPTSSGRNGGPADSSHRQVHRPRSASALGADRLTARCGRGPGSHGPARGSYSRKRPRNDSRTSARPTSAG
jgi:Citrate synthase, C-terminal domain